MWAQRLGLLVLLLAFAGSAHAGDVGYGVAGALSGAGQALQQGAASIQNGLIQQHLMQEQHRLEMERIEAQERREREREEAAYARQRERTKAVTDQERAKQLAEETRLRLEAEERLRKAEQRAAQNPSDLNVGLVAYERGDYAAALARLQQAAEPITLNEFLDKARPVNPGVSDADLATYWQRTYEETDRHVRSAQFYLGNMYYDGQGVPQDYSQAFRWYMKAATAGSVSAQNNLGVMYANGLGVPQDYVQAHQWCNLAAVSGFDTAVKNRDALTKRMTPAQIAEAQKLAVALQAKLKGEALRQEVNVEFDLLDFLRKIEVEQVKNQFKAQTQAEARMTALRPDWKEIVGPDPTTGAAPTPYRQWLARQPAEYRNLVENTEDPHILAKAIDLFKAQTVAGK